MSENQLAYLPLCLANRVSKLGMPVGVGRSTTHFATTDFATTDFATTDFATTDFATIGYVSANAAAYRATVSSQPKQGHRDLGAAVMTDLGAAVKNIEARSWASRPRRMSLAR